VGKQIGRAYTFLRYDDIFFTAKCPIEASNTINPVPENGPGDKALQGFLKVQLVDRMEKNMIAGRVLRQMEIRIPVILFLLSGFFSPDSLAIKHDSKNSVHSGIVAAAQSAQEESQPALRSFNSESSESERVKSLHAFRAEAGSSSKIIWNAQTGLPAHLYNFQTSTSAGSPEEGAREFLQNHRSLLLNGGSTADLRHLTTRKSTNRTHTDFQQYYNNVPVYRAIVTVHQNSSLVTMVQSNYLPNLSIDTTPSISAEEAWQVVKKEIGNDVILDSASRQPLLTIVLEGKVPLLSWRVMVHTVLPFGGWEYLIDAKTGQIVEKNNLLRSVDGTGKVYLDNPTVTPDLTTVPFKYLDGSGYLKGAYANALSYVGANNYQNKALSASFTFDFLPNSGSTGSSTEVFAEQNLYYHVNQIHDYFKNTFGYSDRDQAFPVIVHYPSSGRAMNNAYYDPSCLTAGCIAVGDGTGADTGGFNDLARDAEVIYHEYTHAVIDTIVLLGVRANDYGAAMNEGYADYFSCTNFNDPYEGEWAAGTSDGIRNMENNHKYPDQVNDPSTNAMEAHYTGQIWAGALWDLRKALGSVVADQIIFNSFYYLSQSGNADFGQGLIALLEADQAIYEGAYNDQIRAVLNNRGIQEPQAVSASLVPSSSTLQGTIKAIPSNYTKGTYAQLADHQYIIYVPAGGQLVINLQGPTGSDVDLLVRKGLPVTINTDEFGGFDYVSQSEFAAENLTLNSTSTPPLTEGIYYIAVVNATPTNITYTLKVTITNGATPRNTLMVPVALSSPGANGSFYTTETTLTNRSDSKVTLEMTYLPSFPSTGSEAGAGTVTLSMDPHKQLILNDTIAFFRSMGLTIPDSGSLLGILSIQPVEVNVSQLAVVARTTTKTPSGQAGLAYSGFPVVNATNGAVYISGLRETNQDRSNLAVQNMGTSADGNITLHLTAFDGTTGSSSQAIPEITLAPGQFFQISSVLTSNGLNWSNGYIKVEQTAGSAPFYAYGVINDQVNSDGSFIPPVPATQNSMTRLTLPVVVEAGIFTSELMMTNWSGTSKKINFELSADTLTTADHLLHFNITLEAGRQVFIPGVVAYLRQQGIPGLPPAGTTVAGPLMVTSDDGSMNGVSLGVRTATPGDGGYFGVFNAAIPDSLLSRGSASLFGLQQNDTNRSNLALVNMSDPGSNPEVFTISLYDQSGTKVNSFDKTINAGQWVQINSILANYAAGTTSGYAVVTRTSSEEPFILYGVVNDGAAPGQRTGDGAFLNSSY
jgi:Zn-dependent metalloprotease